RRLPALRLKARENPVKARLAPGTSGALPRCDRPAQGARWGDPTSTDATPPSAWRWRASSMTRTLGPPYCTWRRCEPRGAPRRGAPKRRGRIRSGRKVSPFRLGLFGEPVPRPGHVFHDLAVSLGLGVSRQPAALLRKYPVFR